MNTLPRIVLTAGEPSGIGPDLCVTIAQRDWPCALVVAGDPALLKTRRDQLGLNVEIRVVGNDDAPKPHRANTLLCSPIPLTAPAVCGQLNPDNSAAVLATLEYAAKACVGGRYEAMVTAPIHKGVMNDAGIAFTGHTEYLAERTGTVTPVMLLVAGELRVALATTHLPLASVSAALTRETIETRLRVLNEGLAQQFGIKTPRILVCGLNPHAGEQGHIGSEEIEVIAPAVEAMRSAGLRLAGPLPADTAFTPAMLANCDAVLAMYHDQGLPVVKHAGFGKAVNVTLGLPIVRTSVDHGTALTLAGTGKADAGSLETAMSLALDLVARTRP